VSGLHTLAASLFAATVAMAALAAPASRLSAQTISSAANQTFGVGFPATAISPITVTAGASTPGITESNNIRIRIPATFSMTWNTAITTATFTGPDASKMATGVVYEDAGKVVVLNVNTNFGVSDQITVSGLQFNNFTTVEAVDNLELVLSGSSSGSTADTDDKTIAIGTLTFTEVANQVFTVADPATGMSVVTITDGTATISATNDIRLRIPAALNMTWNTAATTATIGGAAAAKVSTAVTYEDAGKTLVLDVTSNFAAGDQITVSALQYGSFTAVSAAAGIQLVISGPAGSTIATSNRTKQIVQPTIVSAANQTFTVGDAAANISTVTITDNATSPSITAADNIRIRIPTGFNMTWNTADLAATIGGAAAAKVSPVVSYEDGGQTLVLDVISDFVASNQITVSGLQFNNFTAVSAADNLELVVSGTDGGTAASDTRTISISTPMTISSAANQVFAVSQAATANSSITVTEDGSPSITTTNDIRIRIPASINMTWNTADVTATITGSASSKVSTTVSYENGGKVVLLSVTTNFVAGDQVVVSGLQFNNFTAPSVADELELVVSGSFGGATAATDDKTKIVVAPTLSSASNQVFVVADPATAMAAATITDDTDAPSITAANDLRVRIPASTNMTWNTGVTTATITGSGASKVSTTVSYENGGKVLLIGVTSNFAAADQIIVSGLQFNNFTAVSSGDNLELVIAGSFGAATSAEDDKTKTIVAPSLTEAGNQVFTVNDPPTAMSTATITDAAGATSITANNDIRLRIPASLNMVWNTGVSTATIGGAAAGKVSTAVTFGDAGKTLVLDVTSNFVAGDQITVSGLQYSTFTAVSSAAPVQLVVSGSGGGTAATSNTTKQIVQPTILSAADQNFSVGDAATSISTITITDHASAPSITAGDDIRVRIPAGLNMTWNTADVTATIGGGAAAKVSTTVSYEDAGKTLVLNVTSDFVASNQVTVSGLQFNNFTAASSADNLELVVSGASGGTAATNTRTIQIYAAMSMSSAANQIFAVGQTTTAISAITITEDASPSINTSGKLRIRIPTGFSMTWNTGDQTATITGPAASKVEATNVTFENSGQVALFNVLSNFAAGDQVTISGLSFNTFSAADAADNLELVVSGSFSGATEATDDKTKTIVVPVPTLSSAANQLFAVSGPATAMSAATITDHASVATITATNDIRIRIPTGFNMTWNTAITTATITGSDASKVSTTVTYENSAKVLRLNVTTSFTAGDQIVVSGLQFNNFTAASAASGLELVTSGAFGGPTVATDDKTKAITSAGASVTPATAAASKLPSNGTNYTEIFAVQNTGAATDNYDLLITRVPGTRVTTISITGTGVTQGANPDSARLTGLGSSASLDVTVTYAVGNVAAGLTDALTFTARSTTDPTQSDNGVLNVTVVRPNMTVLRDRTPSGDQPPGTEITHTIDVTNAGTAGADGVVLVDSLGANSDFKLGSVVTNLPAGITVALEYSNDGGTSWTYAPVSAACGAPANFDGCVNRVRWRLLSSLSATPPDHTGNVEFISRLR
jgi:hypothetical protein